MISASIPSPSASSFEIGSLELRAYGLMVALGVLVAAWLFSQRFVKRGHSPELASSAIVWAVVAGLIGSRIYHVITDWRTYQGNWGESWQIWQGGLGIPGAVIAAAAVLWVWARQRNIAFTDVADSVAPALPLGQAVGRWGNWFNQELYGRPTDLPWALEIDPEHRRAQYLNDATFHPTFLYECVWNLGLVVFLLWAAKRFSFKPGRLFGLYVLGYSLGRLWIETIRVDFASELLGVRVNIWVMLVFFCASVVYLLWGSRDESEESDSSEENDVSDEDSTETDAIEAMPEDSSVEAQITYDR